MKGHQCPRKTMSRCVLGGDVREKVDSQENVPAAVLESHLFSVANASVTLVSGRSTKKR